MDSPNFYLTDWLTGFKYVYNQSSRAVAVKNYFTLFIFADGGSLGVGSETNAETVEVLSILFYSLVFSAFDTHV